MFLHIDLGNVSLIGIGCLLDYIYVERIKNVSDFFFVFGSGCLIRRMFVDSMDDGEVPALNA